MLRNETGRTQTLWRRLLGFAFGTAVMTGAAHAQMPDIVPVPGQAHLSLGSYDLGAQGYSEEEFFIRGTAQAYKLIGQATPDGRWNAAPAESAPFETRIVVVRPTDPAKFNGTVVVEWLNVSGGADGAADWLMAHREIMRSGYAWVGVSAQRVGVEGGPSLGGLDQPLKKVDPARYGPLNHPGDAFSFDIFSQAGRAVRAAGRDRVLGPLVPKILIAAGESQSATFLTTYVNAVAPLANVFDGFLIHSRFGSSAPVNGGSTINATPGSMPENVKFRTDLSARILTVLTETDVVSTRLPGYWTARQPDNEHLRTWEIAGAAHADTYVLQVGPIDSPSTPLEKIAAAYTPPAHFFGLPIAKPVNSAPQHHYVVEAALSALNTWIRTGNAPASSPRLTLTTGEPVTLVQDAHGIALGGIRTPWVDVPAATLSGVGNSGGGVVGMLFGITEPFDQSTLDRLYPDGKKEYLRRFESSLDSTITAGFLLPADRQEILSLAGAMFPGSH